MIHDDVCLHWKAVYTSCLRLHNGMPTMAFG